MRRVEPVPSTRSGFWPPMAGNRGSVQQGYGGIGPQVCSGRLGKSISCFGYQRYTSSAQVQDKVPDRTSAFPSHLLVAELHNDTPGLLFLFFFFPSSVYLDEFAEDNTFIFLLYLVRG